MVGNFSHLISSELVDLDNICISGHSAGAHLACLTAINYPTLFRRFVGLAGPYDIRDHFGFEHQRGVEQASAMEPAMCI
jgi:dipeptidyl aminopeptidase/acylaminoacyl peptidase